jgi:hypothetical protein
MVSVSCAAENETTGSKVKNFWQKLFNYPANVAKESAKAVADTGTKGVEVIAKEVKTVGQVTSGDVNKAGELVTEPIKGTADTVVTAVTETVNAPIEAAKEEPAAAELK